MAAPSKFKDSDCFCKVMTLVQEGTNQATQNSPSGKVNLKQSFIAFFDALIGILQVVKTITLMAQYETWSDRLQTEVLQYTVDYYKRVIDPIRVYMTSFSRSFSMNSDCSPIATIGHIIHWVKDDVTAELDNIEEELNKALRAIDRVDAKTEKIDRYIAALEEAKRTLEELCGGT